jgi:hypothetical protein
VSYCETYEDFQSGDGCREAITHLAGFSSNDTYRRLVAATLSRIYSLNEQTGNWRIIADGQGDSGSYQEFCDTCNDIRFRSAQLGNYAIFTNDFNEPLAWLFDAGPTGVDQWSAQHVLDLQIIGITKARAITAFSGFMILGNVEIEGQRKAARIYWSDYNAPLSWIPGDTSLASYHEFGVGEKVLRMEPLGKYLIVYTDRAAYLGVISNNPDLVFSFEPIYRGSNIPIYEHAFVNTGREHIYLSENGIYSVAVNNPVPLRPEWVHKASGAIYSGVPDDILGGFDGLDSFGPINSVACKQAVGGYNPLTEEVWFSWPTDDNQCPNMSLVLNLRYGAADIVDHGFTAFTHYIPDARPTVRDWLFEQDVCDRTGQFVKEGLPSEGAGTIDDPPTYLWNSSENPELPHDEDSWCERLGDLRLEDLCDNCEVSTVFIGASAEDFTLKEFDPDVFYRQRYNVDTESYAQDGYYTLLQSDMSQWGMDTEKLIRLVLVDYDAAIQEPPSDLVTEVAHAAQPRCSTWNNIGSKELRCLTEQDEAEHDAYNTRPDLTAKFPTYRRGRYLGYRCYVGGVGGSACFSRIVLAIANAQGRIS